eukprot:scaffold10295_cov75-Phaeocystis_antarctica.AAC.2
MVVTGHVVHRPCRPRPPLFHRLSAAALIDKGAVAAAAQPLVEARVGLAARREQHAQPRPQRRRRAPKAHAPHLAHGGAVLTLTLTLTLTPTAVVPHRVPHVAHEGGRVIEALHVGARPPRAIGPERRPRRRARRRVRRERVGGGGEARVVPGGCVEVGGGDHVGFCTAPRLQPLRARLLGRAAPRRAWAAATHGGPVCQERARGGRVAHERGTAVDLAPWHGDLAQDATLEHPLVLPRVIRDAGSPKPTYYSPAATSSASPSQPAHRRTSTGLAARRSRRRAGRGSRHARLRAVSGTRTRPGRAAAGSARAAVRASARLQRPRRRRQGKRRARTRPRPAAKSARGREGYSTRHAAWAA